jgi:hypothetical protein
MQYDYILPGSAKLSFSAIDEYIITVHAFLIHANINLALKVAEPSLMLEECRLLGWSNTD